MKRCFEINFLLKTIFSIIIFITFLLKISIQVEVEEKELKEGDTDEVDHIKLTDFVNIDDENYIKEVNKKQNYKDLIEKDKNKLKSKLKIYEDLEYYDFDHLFYLQLAMKTHKYMIILFYDDESKLENLHDLHKNNSIFGANEFKNDNYTDHTIINETITSNFNYIHSKYNLTEENNQTSIFVDELHNTKHIIEQIERKELHKTKIKFCLYKINNTNLISTKNTVKDQEEVNGKIKDEINLLYENDIIREHFRHNSTPFYILYTNEKQYIYDKTYNHYNFGQWLDLIMFPKLHSKLDDIKMNSEIFSYYLIYTGDNLNTFNFLKELSAEINVYELDYCEDHECSEYLESHYGGLVFYIKGVKHVFDWNLENNDDIANWIISKMIGLNKKLDTHLSHLLFKLNKHKVVLFLNETSSVFEIDSINNNKNNNTNNTESNNHNNHSIDSNSTASKNLTESEEIESSIIEKTNNKNFLKVFENVSRHFYGNILFFHSYISNENEKTLMTYLNIDPNITSYPLLLYIGDNNHHFAGPKKFTFDNIMTPLINQSNAKYYETFLNDNNLNYTDNYYKEELLSNKTLDYIEMTIYRIITINLNLKEFPGLDFEEEDTVNSIKNKDFIADSNNIFLKSYTSNYSLLPEYNNITYPFYWDNSKLFLVHDKNIEHIIEKLDGDIVLITKWRSEAIFLNTEIAQNYVKELVKEENIFGELFFYYLENQETINKYYKANFSLFFRIGKI